MPETHRPSRRTLIAGTAAAAAAAGLPVTLGAARAADARKPRPLAESYRWRSVAIGGTGFVTGVLFHPAEQGLAYARTDIGGAYRWDDSTSQWIPLTDHLGWDDWNLLGVEALAVDPADADRVYLALGTYAQSWAGNGAVLRSDDRGATWQRAGLSVKLGANEDGGATPLADPADPRRAYAYDTAAGTVHVSTDAGATFTAAATGLPSGDAEYQLAAAPGRSGDLWLSGKGGGLHRSTDGGATFTRHTGVTASHTVGFGKAADGAGYPAVYHVAQIAGQDITAVHRSDDGGESWVRINDDAHQWGWTGQTITGDPRVHGRVYLGTNGRGIQYGEPA